MSVGVALPWREALAESLMKIVRLFNGEEREGYGGELR